MFCDQQVCHPLDMVIAVDRDIKPQTNKQTTILSIAKNNDTKKNENVF